MKILLTLFLLLAVSAWAGDPPEKLFAGIISEGAGAMAPGEISFPSIQFVPSAPSGVTVAAVPDSLEWVRLNDVLVFPRIRIHVSIDRASDGMVSYAGTLHPLVTRDGKTYVNLPIALIANPANHIDVQAQDSQTKTHVSFTVKYLFNDGEGHVFFDPSCSKYSLDTKTMRLSPYEWLYIGCRHEDSVEEGLSKTTVMLSVFWNASSTLILDDVPSNSTSPVSSVRLNEAPGLISLGSVDSKVEIGYQFLDHPHHVTLAVGLGPYEYRFWGGSESVNDYIALLTLYGSYALGDTSRFFMFGATDLNSRPNTDFGLYYAFETARVLDRRVAVNVMLGAHALGIKTMGSYFVNFGLPQGIELVYYDFLQKRYNLSAGGFIYPSINGTAYDNVWIRYGTSKFFAEINYIFFQETIHNTSYASQSFGFSLGFPLVRAF